MTTEVPTKIIIDCATGEQIIEPLTEAEKAYLEQVRIETEERRALVAAEEQARAEAKASALAKLAELGLTEEEAKAIAG